MDSEDQTNPRCRRMIAHIAIFAVVAIGFVMKPIPLVWASTEAGFGDLPSHRINVRPVPRPSALAHAQGAFNDGSDIETASQTEERNHPSFGQANLNNDVPSEIATALDSFEESSNFARIAWNEPKGFAAFQRAGLLWLLIEGENPSIAVEALNPSASDLLLPEVVQVQSLAGTLVGLSMAPTIFPHVSWDEHGILVQTRRDVGGIAAHQVVASGLASSDEFVLPAQGSVVEFVDPVIGDHLQALLTLDPSRQPASIAQYDVEFLPSFHGFVWKPLIGPLATRISTNATVLIRKEDQRAAATMAVRSPGDGAPNHRTKVDASPSDVRGILETPTMTVTEPWTVVTDHEQGASKSKTDTVSVGSVSEGVAIRQSMDEPGHASEPEFLGIVNLEEDVRGYWHRRAGLLEAMNTEVPAQELAARIELAKVELAYGLGAEASSTVAPLLDVEPSGLNLVPRAIDAAASILMGRAEPALQTLQHEEYTDDQELSLWRLVAASGLDEWDIVSSNLASASATLADYPNELVMRLGPDVLLAHVRFDQLQDAYRILDQLIEVDRHESGTFPGDLFRANLLLTENRNGAAAEALTSAMDTLTWHHLVTARFQKTMLDRANGEAIPDTIRALEDQQRLWRGHVDEIDMLLRLADLYGLVENRMAALNILLIAREYLSTNKDDPARVATLEEKMRAILRAGLVESVGADPLGSLALVNSYGGILSGFEDKAGIVTQLAQHLADSGFEDAALRLTRQYLYREDGSAVPEAHRMVAAFHVQAGRPNLAIEQLSAVPEAERINSDTLMMAEAFLESDDYSNALKALDHLSGPESQRLRERALFRQKEWEALVNRDRRSSNSEANKAPDGDEGDGFSPQEIIAYAAAGQSISDNLTTNATQLGTPQRHALLNALNVEAPIESNVDDLLSYARERTSHLRAFTETLNQD